MIETAAGVGAVVVALALLLLSRRNHGDRGDRSVPSTKVLPDLLFEDGVPVDRIMAAIVPGVVAFSDTGRRPTDKRHRLECDVLFDGFLAANCGLGEDGKGKEGRFVVQTRTTLMGIKTQQYRAIGWIAGSLWQQGVPAPFGIGDFTCRAGVEDWQIGKQPSEDWPLVKPASVSPQLEDGRSYRVVFTSEPVSGGGWSVRLNVGDFYSGPILSDNCNIDRREQAVAFAALGKGRVRLSTIVSTWS